MANILNIKSFQYY